MQKKKVYKPRSLQRGYNRLGGVSAHAYELYSTVGYIPILKNAHLACIDHWTGVYSKKLTSNFGIKPASSNRKTMFDGVLETKIKVYNFYYFNNYWKQYKPSYEPFLEEHEPEQKPFTHLFTILRNPYDRYVSSSWQAYRTTIKRLPTTAKEIIDFCDKEWKKDNYVFDIHQEPQHKFLNSFVKQDIPIVYFNMDDSVFDDIETYFKDKINKKCWYKPLGGETGENVFGSAHRADEKIIKEMKKYLFTKPSFHKYMNWEISELMKIVSYMKPGKER